MAVSIDTCTAIARFLNRLWERTCAQVAYPRVFAEPVPVLVETRTPGHGYGFSGVWVRVALENPRVTHANPYTLLWATAQLALGTTSIMAALGIGGCLGNPVSPAPSQIGTMAWHPPFHIWAAPATAPHFSILPCYV